jgi:hypothetical protein
MTKIVQCKKCGNMERLDSVYCRICGDRLENPVRDRRIAISSWLLMAAGIATTLAIGFASRRESAAVPMLSLSLLFLLGTRRAVRRLDYDWHWAPPLYYSSRLNRKFDIQHLEVPDDLRGEAAPAGDRGREAEHLEKAYKSLMMVFIYDRNIGLLLENMGSEVKDDGYLIGKTRKALNFYARNEERLVGLIGKDEYGKRIGLFNHVVDVLVKGNLDSKARRLDRDYREVVERMTSEIESIEAGNEAEEASAGAV